ncbi:alpha/beta hydrolase [Nocardioides sp. 31GB23]|uniref:alpha/beta fold hydrolase n=1 Tax=Nocardioides sp. 31GB23 TaxID=3156065 RepID=UPI0032AF8302
MEGRWQLLDVPQGQLEVEVSGRGEPVVVLQTALDADELRPLGRHLATPGRHRVLQYHRRGYAGSSAPRGRPSLARDAADAAEVVRAMGVAPAHVVGVSYSAAVALRLAHTDPELVHSLSVVEPPPTGTPGGVDFRRACSTLVEKFETAGAGVALDDFMTVLVGESWRDLGAPDSVRRMERDAATFFAWDLPALRSWRFGAEEARAIRCPVLLVGGGRTAPWFSEMRRRLVRLLPHATEVLVDGADHTVASTHAPQLAGVLLRHLRDHPGAALPD